MDLAVRLTGAVESTGHKGVVLGCIAENHQLCSADALTVGGQLTGLLHGFAHQLDGVHVQARLGGTDIHRAAHDVGLGQCTGNGLDQAHGHRRKSPCAPKHRSRPQSSRRPFCLGSGIQRFGKVTRGLRPVQAPSSMAMGVTLIRLLIMGMPYSALILLTTGTRFPARRVILL